MDVSVVIPTYNGEKTIPVVLEALRGQSGVDNASWEVIVVDNNSTDGTGEMVEKFRAEWPEKVPLRYLFEPRPGAHYARQKGLNEAAGKYTAFLDDDNIPSADWLACVLDFGGQHSSAGAWGGNIYPRYEIEPPGGFERVAPVLAIYDRGPEPFKYTFDRMLLPVTAGLAVLTAPYREVLNGPMTITGLTADRTVTGEDLESVAKLRMKGFEIWHCPGMKIHRLIGRDRLSDKALLRLCRSVGLSRYILRGLRTRSYFKRAIMTFLYMVNDLRKITLHMIRYGLPSKMDIVAKCELTLYLYGFLSPFYWWRQKINAVAGKYVKL